MIQVLCFFRADPCSDSFSPFGTAATTPICAVYTTKRFACNKPAPTLLEMTIYWIVEAFTEHPAVRPLPTQIRLSSDPRAFTAR